MLNRMLGVLLTVILSCGLLTGQNSPVNKRTSIEISYEVKPLDGVNGPTSEITPVLYGNQLIFASDREFNLLNYGENRWKRDGYYNLFSIDLQKQTNDTAVFGDWKLFSDKLVSNSHSGPIAFLDKNTAIFSKVEVGPKAKNKVYKPKLYVARKEKEIWHVESRLPFVKDEFAYTHPSISKDGKKLYFSSDMDGGKGGSDIYVSHNIDGTWFTPVNLGDSINTAGNELFPSLRDSVLFFSSDKSGGLGGLDIYQATIDGSLYRAVKNLGAGINSKADDFGMTFTENGKSGFFSSNRDGAKGKDDIYFFKVIKTAIVESRELCGQFHYRKLGGSPTDMEVLLMDEEGNLVFETKTNEDGKFTFKNLDWEEDYSIKVRGEDDDMELVIFNKDGEKVAFLLSNESGAFIYKRLNRDNIGTLSLIDEEDIELNQADFSGQFVYEKIANDYPQDMEVYLVDEEGNIVYTTKTDEYGNFVFRNLNMSNNYTVKVNNDDEDISLLIYNSKNNVTGVLKMNEYGEFIYRKLNNEHANDLSVIEMKDNQLIGGLTTTVFGQFEYRNLDKDFGEDGMAFKVLDGDGEVIMSAVTDKEGFFRLKNLPMTESYVFKVDEDDPELESQIQLTILNRNGKKVALLDKDTKGYFVYTPLGLGGELHITEKEEDEPLLVEFTNKDIPMIYYDNNSYALDKKAVTVLQTVIDKMTAKPELKLEVSSYADSKASEEYNLKLSNRRSNSVIDYLVRKGIKRERLNGNAYGESNLLNDCDDEADCPEELHRINRRSEFRLYLSD